MLYQLSYTHHDRRWNLSFPRPAEKKSTGSSGVLAHTFPGGPYRGGRTYFAAMDFAVSESGPGWGTKTASR